MEGSGLLKLLLHQGFQIFGTQDLVLFAPQIHIFTKSRLDIFLYSCYSQHIKNNVKFPQHKSSRTGHLFEYIP